MVRAFLTRPLARAIASTLLSLSCIGVAIRAALAQDFASPAPAVPSVSTLDFIERGLAPATPASALEFAATRWFGLDGLSTQAAALGVGWRSARAAAGISRTGDPMIGWTAAGLAAGAGTARAGVALRGVARRDRVPFNDAGGPLPGVGLEAGGGAWVQMGSDLRLWAASPQIWTRGTAPPLARALEIGVAISSGATCVWLARRAAPPAGVLPSERVGGVEIAWTAARLWLEARDHPLRGSAGCAVRVRRLIATFGIDSHPVLAETFRFSLEVMLHRGGP
jgi:hypothetical protein